MAPISFRKRPGRSFLAVAVVSLVFAVVFICLLNRANSFPGSSGLIQSIHGRITDSAIGTVSEIIIHDLDGNKKPEILAVKVREGHFSIVSSDGVVKARFQMIFQDLLDLDRDGRCEIACYAKASAETMTLVLIDSRFQVAWKKRITRMPEYYPYRLHSVPYRFAVADVTRDGTAEVILYSPQFGWEMAIAMDGRVIPREELLEYLPLVIEEFDPSTSPFVVRSPVRLRGEKFRFDGFGTDVIADHDNSVDDDWSRDYPVIDSRGRRIWTLRISRQDAHQELPPVFNSVETADLDGDGFDELLLGGYNKIYIFSHDGKPQRIFRGVFH